MPIAKAMDDCMIAYGQNGEAVAAAARVSGAPDSPGFEGIFHTK